MSDPTGNEARPAAAPQPPTSPAPESSASGSAASQGAAQAGERPSAAGWEAASAGALRDNLDLLKSLFLGLVLTALFYEVFPIPFLDQGRVLELFQNDNWVSPVIVAMTLWSLLLLMFKFLRHRRELAAWQAFRAPEVAALLQRTIGPKDVERLVATLADTLSAQRVKHFQASIVYRRVVRALMLVRSASSRESLDSLLDYQGDIEVKKLESAYTVLQVFIWAIPILGFIGTVLGIGSSVHEFAQFIQTAQSGGEFTAQMRSALGGVTSGLSVAFNTTFLALVLVIPVMLLTSFLNKSEDELLLEIEEYCLEELLPRLRLRPGEEAMAQGYEEHLNRIMRLSETWLGQLEPTVQRISRQAEMVGHQLSGIQPLIKEFTDRLLPPAAPSSPPAGPGAVAEAPGGVRSGVDGQDGSPERTEPT